MKFALLQALAIALGGLSSMGAVLLVLLLLNSKAGVRAALAFAGGYWGGYATIGMIAVYVGQGVAQAEDAGAASPVRAGIFTLLGSLLLVVAIRRWRNPPQPDAPPSAFMAKIDSFTAIQALGFGLAIPLLNFKNLAIYLSAVAVLAAAPLAPLEAVACVLLTTFVFCGAMLSPLLIYGLAGKRARALLTRMRSWIEANSHPVALVILTVLSIVFLTKGGREAWVLFAGG